MLLKDVGIMESPFNKPPPPSPLSETTPPLNLDNFTHLLLHTSKRHEQQCLENGESTGF